MVLVYWTMSFLRRHAKVHSDDFLILVILKTKTFKVTTSNTRNLNGIPTFTLQIFLVLVYWTMSLNRRHGTVHFDDFFILFAFKAKAFKVTTSNKRNLKGIPTFTSQIFLVLVYWTMSFLPRHATVHFDDFLILVTFKTKAFKVTRIPLKFFVFEVLTLKALVLEVASMRKSSKCTVPCLRFKDIVQ